jgi:ubiquinone/menaquinone biosynthesis C-methylase UbiE
MSDLAAMTATLALFADPNRVRLMALLAAHELTVGELTRITGLTQSRVSSHLGRLRDAALLVDRKVGVSTHYRVEPSQMPDGARKTWETIREQLDDAILSMDRQRATQVIRARTDGYLWADLVAGQMEYHYSPGRTWEATARGLLGLLELGDVLDIGSGDGVMAQLLARRARTITCLDRSTRVIEAATKRLERYENIRLVAGDMHAMPLPDDSFDQVLLLNVLTHAERPAEVVGEVFRVLRPGGQFVLVTLDEHPHAEISTAYQHVNAGFSPATVRDLLGGAGFVIESCEVSSRERRKPYFRVVTAYGSRPQVNPAIARPRHPLATPEARQGTST